MNQPELLLVKKFSELLLFQVQHECILRRVGDKTVKDVESALVGEASEDWTADNIALHC